jgi:hypothetical protein
LRRDCLIKHVIEGKIETRIEAVRRREWRRKQLRDVLKEKRGCWKLKEEALDRTLWRTHFGRGYGPVSKTNYETNEWVNEWTSFACNSVIGWHGPSDWWLWRKIR